MEFVNEGIIDQDMVDAESTAVNVLLVIGVVIEASIQRFNLRLRGGVGELALRDNPMDMVIESAAPLLNRLMNRGADMIVRQYQRYRDRARSEPQRPINYMPYNNRQRGRAMLTWKNSLTRMFHTYQKYVMSPILSTKLATGSLYVHRTYAGIGPHLYAAFQSQIRAADDVRTKTFGEYLYWDGGMAGVPSDEVLAPFYEPKKNYGVGANMTVYVFSADWPGTIMNRDPLTQDSTSDYKYLAWEDVNYQGTVTTYNYPRAWDDVFNNQLYWHYCTVYGTQYKFDVTNTSFKDHWLEISLFKFKADIDAMDYEKQCLAHQGGYHGTTNAYIQQLPMMPASDVIIVKTKRYLIKGQQVMTATDLFTEGPMSNNRTIKWNIKRKYVIKRPNLNSYETNMTESTIFNQYYDAQKGLYFRVMGFATDAAVNSNQNGTAIRSVSLTTNPNIPVSTDTGVNKPDRLGQGLMVTMWRKSYFKLDENSVNF